MWISHLRVSRISPFHHAARIKIGVPKIVIVATWQKCANSLKTELPPQQFNTWIKPIRVLGGSNTLHLLTPNRFVLEWVREHFLSRIEELLSELSAGSPPNVVLEVADSKESNPVFAASAAEPMGPAPLPLTPVTPENTHDESVQLENFPAASPPVFGNTSRKLSFKGELN